MAIALSSPPLAPAAKRKDRSPARWGIALDSSEPLIVDFSKPGAGKHSTEIPDGLAEAVESHLRELEFTGTWRLQTRSVRVHGSSRHLTGDVRAIEITSYNTIHLIVQPGDAKSRRRCDLTPPPGTNLEYAFSKLRPAVAPEALGADDETVALVDRMNTMLDPKEPRATKLVHSANRADQRAEKHAAKFFRSQALRMEFIREIADHLVEDAIKASLCNAVMLSMWLKRYGTRSTLPLKMLRTALIVDAQLVTPAADGVHYLTEEGDTYLQQLLEERTKLALRQAESQRVIARRAAIVAQRNRDRAHQKYLASEQALAEANQRLADAESELTKLTQGFGSY